MIDEAQIRELVGPAAFLRGQLYANAGAVSGVEVLRFSGGRQLTGRVRGNAVRPYEVSVHLADTPTGPSLRSGDCTCPVGWSCKHVAALLLHVAAKARTRDPRPAATAPPWAAALKPLLDERAQPATDEPGVALQFELVEANGRVHGLTLRPVLRGAPNSKSAVRWVRTGISWGNLTYHAARRASPAAFRLLEEIATLSVPSQRYYYSAASTVTLETFPSGRIWAVLAAAAEAGLPLVRSGASGAPVLLGTEPVRVSLDVTDSGEAWRLRPVVTSGADVLPPGTFILLGEPAHGVAWWSPDAGTPLHLAALETSLADGVHALVTHRGGLEVPTADVPSFLREYYPSLRRRVALTSSDGSVELPAPKPPRLLVRAVYGAARHVEVTWSWRYSIGEAVREVPIGLPAAADADRDPEVEAKLLLGACACAEALPGLLDPGPQGTHGPRLRPRAELVGADALIGLVDVLACLAELPGVDVERSGDVPWLRLAANAPVVSLSGASSGTDWFDLDVEVTVDGEVVPFVVLFAALAQGERYLVLDSGVYIDLDRPELRRLQKAIDEARALVEPGRATARVSRFQVSLWDDLLEVSTLSNGVASDQATAWVDAVQGLRGLDSVADVAVPDSLRAVLRPYQQAGFAWLAFLYSHRLGGVLADDMGLGKTVQAIALICREREAAAASTPAAPPFLVVAPTSVVANWVAETRRFAPHLAVAAITETYVRRKRPLDEVVAGADVVVTSYALLRLEYQAYAELGWSALILDEAQAVKNHASKGYQCVRTLPVPVKLAITGTPMENNLLELWATFSIVAPGLFPDAKRFTDYYRNPIERGDDPERLAQLRRRIAPLLLRRRKEEVAADLPDKIEQIVTLELAPKHRRLYDTFLARERQKVLGLLGDVDRHRIEILRSLTVLRQAALDVSLVDPAHADVPATKLDALMDQLNEVVAEGHSVLVFSQFTRFLARVRDRLDAAGLPYCYLDGRTRNRPAVVESFARGEAPIFLLSIKAGGVGLNLTQADYCILLDPWWNPATEAQAVDRAHRIGQTRTVMVYRLVARDTIEEKVMALKEGKAKLFNSVFDGSAAPDATAPAGASAALTAEDIRALLD